MRSKGIFEVVPFLTFDKDIAFSDFVLRVPRRETEGYPKSELQVSVFAKDSLQAGERLLSKAHLFADLLTYATGDGILVTNTVQLENADQPPFPVYDWCPPGRPTEPFSKLQVPTRSIDQARTQSGRSNRTSGPLGTIDLLCFRKRIISDIVNHKAELDSLTGGQEKNGR